MDIICFFIMPILWFGSCISTIIHAITWLIKAISRKETKSTKRKLLISLALSVSLPLVIAAFYPNNEGKESTSNITVETTAPIVTLAFLDDFTEYGYTDTQIDSMREILLNVGITEITDLEITPVSYGTQVVKGVAFRYDDLGWDKEVHVQFNIENGVLYYIHIYCPSYGTSSQPPYLSGLKDRRAELYYDTEGGYLKRIDWKSKSVVDY